MVNLTYCDKGESLARPCQDFFGASVFVIGCFIPRCWVGLLLRDLLCPLPMIRSLRQQFDLRGTAGTCASSRYACPAILKY